MSIPESLQRLTGVWKGNNRLHVSWLPNPVVDSDATATVTSRVGGQFLEIAYTWKYEGKPQEGVVILGGDNKTDAVNAFWTDSWHMAHQVMMCEGKTNDEGNVSVKGFYKVPDHPDWGWRTEIFPGGDSFRYLMYNVSPEGVEEIAVEMDLTRQ
jgi:hypothetical protein